MPDTHIQLLFVVTVAVKKSNRINRIITILRYVPNSADLDSLTAGKSTFRRAESVEEPATESTLALGLYRRQPAHSSLAKREMPSERRYGRLANPDETRLDSEIILTSQKINSYAKPTLSCDSSLS